MAILTRYTDSSNDIISFAKNTETYMREQLTSQGVNEDEIRTFMAGFVPTAAANNKVVIEIYTLHNQYGTAIRNSLYILRTNEQHWQYDPQSDYPVFSEAQKQAKFDKSIDKIIHVENTMNTRMPVLAQEMLRVQQSQ